MRAGRLNPVRRTEAQGSEEPVRVRLWAGRGACGIGGMGYELLGAPNQGQATGSRMQARDDRAPSMPFPNAA